MPPSAHLADLDLDPTRLPEGPTALGLIAVQAIQDLATVDLVRLTNPTHVVLEIREEEVAGVRGDSSGWGGLEGAV